jgi:hypothetical protein
MNTSSRVPEVRSNIKRNYCKELHSRGEERCGENTTLAPFFLVTLDALIIVRKAGSNVEIGVKSSLTRDVKKRSKGSVAFISPSPLVGRPPKICLLTFVNA